MHVRNMKKYAKKKMKKYEKNMQKYAEICKNMKKYGNIIVIFFASEMVLKYNLNVFSIYWLTKMIILLIKVLKTYFRLQVYTDI